MEWGRGNRDALNELAPRVQRELHAIARSYLKRNQGNHTLQPTALINEAFIRLIDQQDPVHWESRAHFFGIAARMMRLVLVDYARARYAEKRGAGDQAITLEDAHLLTPQKAPDILEIDEALDHLAKVDARKAQVIELRHFGGLTREEVASTLGLTVATVKRDLRLAEAWLRRFLAGQDV